MLKNTGIIMGNVTGGKCLVTIQIMRYENDEGFIKERYLAPL